MSKIVFVFLGAFFAALQSRNVGNESAQNDESIFDGLKSAVNDAVSAASKSIAPAPLSFGTPFDSLIIQSANSAGIDPALLYRLLKRESGFMHDVISGARQSPAGAIGIAQFMPATALEWLGSVDAAKDPAKAIPGAAKYLAWLINRVGGNVEKAVAAYNWGIGNLQRKGYAAAPKETRDYVQAVYFGA